MDRPLLATMSILLFSCTSGCRATTGSRPAPKAEPPANATAALPSDWCGTPIGDDGGLQYDPRGATVFGTRIVPGVSGGFTEHVRQESALPGEPYVLTVNRRYALECVSEVFAIRTHTSAERKELAVERVGTPTVLTGWAAPRGPCDPAFADIAVGWKEPIRYRFKAEPNGRYEVVFGLCEGHHAHGGQRVLELQIEGRTQKTVDPIADQGRNVPAGYVFDAADTNGDGWLDLAVATAPAAPDENSILNVLWVFPAGKCPSLPEILEGRHNQVALAYVPCGTGALPSSRDDVLILRLRSPQGPDITAVPTLTIQSDQRVEIGADRKTARIGSRTLVCSAQPFARVDESPGRTVLVLRQARVPAGGEQALVFGIHRGPGEGVAPVTPDEAPALRR